MQSEKSECPTCGEKYSSQEDMRIHHARKHGESIAGFDKECPYCESTFTAQSKEQIHCSWSCSSKAQRTKQTVECDNCGEKTEKHQFQLEKYDRHFCSQKCRHEAGNPSGKDHHNWVEPNEVKCWWCADTVEKNPAYDELHKRNFCSTKCHGKWKSWNGIHPQDPQPDYDLPKWEFDKAQNPKRDITVEELLEMYS